MILKENGPDGHGGMRPKAGDFVPPPEHPKAGADPPVAPVEHPKTCAQPPSAPKAGADPPVAPMEHPQPCARADPPAAPVEHPKAGADPPVAFVEPPKIGADRPKDGRTGDELEPDVGSDVDVPKPEVEAKLLNPGMANEGEEEDTPAPKGVGAAGLPSPLRRGALVVSELGVAFWLNMANGVSPLHGGNWKVPDG